MENEFSNDRVVGLTALVLGGESSQTPEDPAFTAVWRLLVGTYNAIYEVVNAEAADERIDLDVKVHGTHLVADNKQVGVRVRGTYGWYWVIERKYVIG